MSKVNARRMLYDEHPSLRLRSLSRQAPGMTSEGAFVPAQLHPMSTGRTPAPVWFPSRKSRITHITGLDTPFELEEHPLPESLEV
jgi:hypothetical protein